MSFPSNKEKKENCPEVVCEKSDPLGTYRRFAQQGSRSAVKFKDEEDEIFDEVEKKADDKEDLYKMCPNSRESLGFFTWNFLHTMTAYYPAAPSEAEKQKMTSFFDAFATFYPCKPCARHFQHDILKNPPIVDDNKSLSIWLCERHNVVNKYLGKPQFDCSFENLDKRWRTGFDHCKNETNTPPLQH